jgi:deoxycytidylate deaminase
MYLAHSASYRSGDLARQVGAAILTDRGDVLSVACNEVPRHGGGQHWEGDPGDARDLVLGEDQNDILKNKILERVLHIIESLKKGSDTGSGQLALGQEDKLEELRKTGILDITEYGRSVHAEMECLLSCARNGISPKGTILFTTTFPCHNCARHIISSGIKRVVYVEPYPKSKALQLHGDEISLPIDQVKWEGATGTEGDAERVVFEPFIGIGPRRYMEWFGLRTATGRRIERKTKDGKAVHEVSATLRDIKTPESEFSYLQREVIAFDQLVKIDTAFMVSVTSSRFGEFRLKWSVLQEQLDGMLLPSEWRESIAGTDWTDLESPNPYEEIDPKLTKAEKAMTPKKPIVKKPRNTATTTPSQ